MGTGKVIMPEKEQEQQFVIKLLRDVHALERMLKNDVFEKEPIRIGAEQELCFVDKNRKPAMSNMAVLERAKHDLFTTELARFNAEINIEPLKFTGKCLSRMEKDICDLVDIMRKHAAEEDVEVILTGILPTVRKIDLDFTSLTPFPRYRALLDAITRLRGNQQLRLSIQGIDELVTKHDSPMPEACNTGFQVHLQVTPDDFAAKYNVAQAIAGPALAIGTNSPMLFGRRLWHETRIALFRQAVDVRIAGDNLRTRSPRVMFGNDWVKKSILEIYREDIVRFKVLLSSTLKENSLKVLDEGGIPELHSLLVHNSTVYRWNRPCYGVANGVPHLRIENRVLPSGPTIKDEIANAALWLGLMNGLGDRYGDVSKVMDFDMAKANFLMACRYGMHTKFYWVNGKKMYASELFKKELIPIAREGLKKAKVNVKDIDHYMGILEGRIKKDQTGSQWMLNSYSKLVKETSKQEALAAITNSIIKQQQDNTPVHNWKLADIKDLGGVQPSEWRVEEFMHTDLFTVDEEDVIELVAEVMDWERLRYIPVENKTGKLVGLLTDRILRRYLIKNHYKFHKADEPEPKEGMVTAKMLMIENPITVSRDDNITKAMEIMRDNGIGCLPVVDNDELQGIITEHDFLNVSGRLNYDYFKMEIGNKRK